MRISRVRDDPRVHIAGSARTAVASSRTPRDGCVTGRSPLAAGSTPRGYDIGSPRVQHPGPPVLRSESSPHERHHRGHRPRRPPHRPGARAGRGPRDPQHDQGPRDRWIGGRVHDRAHDPGLSAQGRDRDRGPQGAGARGRRGAGHHLGRHGPPGRPAFRRAAGPGREEHHRGRVRQGRRREEHDLGQPGRGARQGRGLRRPARRRHHRPQHPDDARHRRPARPRARTTRSCRWSATG